MILILFIAIPVACGLVAWAFGRVRPAVSRWLVLLASAADFVLFIVLAVRALSGQAGGWPVQVSLPWIPSLGIAFSLAADGLSLPLLGLTAFLGMVSVLASWRGIRERVGFYHLNLALVLAGVGGVFLAVDLFLFAFFWELMLVPMYFIIELWGHEGRHRAALKFFIYTQIGGLLMLVAIIVLALEHAAATGVLTFDSKALLGTALSPALEMLLMLGFFAAFAVKLPAFPLHTWLPDAHTEAPTAGSVLLAGLLLKTGGYGLLRFVVTLFPRAAHEFAPIAMILAVAGILYGGLMALGQNDFKRLVAYTSVSHLGFVLLGVFAFNPEALQGAVVQMVGHGLSTGAFFVLVGSLQDRIHTRELGRMGGLWAQVPRMGAAALALTLALVGLPGLVNFVGEFLVLLGTYRVSVPLAVLGGSGLVLAVAYGLRAFGLAFHGGPRETWSLPDLTGIESGVLYTMIVLLVVLGFYPGPLLRVVAPAVAGLLGASG